MAFSIGFSDCGLRVGVCVTKFTLKAIEHYTQNCKKCSYLPYPLQLFVTTAMIFSTVLYMSNDFRNKSFGNIFAVLSVVCKSLYMLSYSWRVCVNLSIISSGDNFAELHV